MLLLPAGSAAERHPAMGEIPHILRLRLALQASFVVAGTAASDRAPRSRILDGRGFQAAKGERERAGEAAAGDRGRIPLAHRQRTLTLLLPVALLNLRGLFFSSVLLNEESNSPHFNYTRAPFIIPLDLFK